jgi:CBS domain-containing protein
MSDNTPDTRQHSGGDAGDSIGRTSSRGGAARRTAVMAGEPPPAAAATAGATSRHLRDAAGVAMRRATDAPRSVGESATRHVQDVASRLADTVQDSARDMQAVFALPMFAPPMFALGGSGAEHLQDLSEAAGTVVESMMRSNAHLLQELFRLTSPATAIDFQRRTTAEYLDSMLHGAATLLRAAHRAVDHSLRPLEEHVARCRQRHTAQPNGQGESHNRVADLMRTAPPMVTAEDTAQRAVQLMREADLGGLPVRDGDRLVGMVTDRDIALRLVAEGRDPTLARVRDVMTPDVPFVFEDDAVEHVAEDMADQRLRRLPVLNREKRLVGVISLVDLARRDRRAGDHRVAPGTADRGGSADRDDTGDRNGTGEAEERAQVAA